ncbi:MAG TPA: PAS domain S-box protein [Pedobacter sp.]|uniref:PAS domain S-box protein n=1 Tax=Pedobacter sp. TaxID=1411316 RepID=UPI002BBB9F4F|nr:PAS domain S-box protein [Pedobacter sp.]HMI01578.1 PAS domain S-box protein [Pedobacter sp.]
MLPKRNSSASEDERIKALHDYNILDTPQEYEFDNISKLAGLICNAPIALITLVDEERLFFKSLVGAPVQEVPREVSFSAFTIQGDDVLEVPDALLDERFSSHPGVISGSYVRFYAGAPLIDANGYKLGVVGVFDTVPRTITREQKDGLKILAKEIITHIMLKKKSAELDAKTRRFEEMLNLSTVSPEIHCILDYEGRILFINDAVTSILEYSAEEATGLNMWEFCNKEDAGGVVGQIETGLKQGVKQFNIDFRIVSKSGITRWLSWNMVAKAGRWYTYGRDITENKRVENELMKLSFVASKVNNAVVINDANNHVTWVNDAFEKITGFTLEDLRGKRLGDLITGPKTDLELLGKARGFTRQNKSFTVDLLAYRKDKKEIWLSIYNTVVLNDEGNVDIEVEIIIDITDKKKAEAEMLQAKEQALQLSEAKEMFLSVMSHEIRTPLNAVIGMTHLLLDNNPRPSQMADLNILKFSSENLLNIINDILDFTKIETGNMQLENMPLSIKALAADILISLKVSAKKKENKLELSIDERIPENILGDKTRLYQILMNLLGNAVKFTNKGTILLLARLEQETATGTEIYFEIKDDGIGIPQDKLSYIFETFTQAKTDISRKYGGTGLGLAITKKLLRLYNSDIMVKSEEGVGTAFSFTILFKKAAAGSSTVQALEGPESFAGKKILVVDDNEINILVAGRMLSKWGFELDFASGGVEAIAKVKCNKYDLIFMDIKMPGIDGFETTSIIRKIEGDYFKSVPIIALTASTLQDENLKFKVSGMNGHILKPFKPADIRNIISAHISK